MIKVEKLGESHIMISDTFDTANLSVKSLSECEYENSLKPCQHAVLSGQTLTRPFVKQTSSNTFLRLDRYLVLTQAPEECGSQHVGWLCNSAAHQTLIRSITSVKP